MTDSATAFFEVARIDLDGLLSAGISPIVQRASETRGTWHPNGFVVFELGPLPSGALRLHIWPEEERVVRHSSVNPHTHPWDLYAVILAGTYAERLLEPSATAVGGEFHAAEIDYLRDRDALSPSGTCRLRPQSAASFTVGQAHTVPAGAIHETLVPAGTFASTLLVTSPPRLASVTVYSRTRLSSGGHSRVSLSPGFQRRLLEELQARVVGADEI